MGREYRDVTVKVACRVSRHNSEQDDKDDALVDELQEHIGNFVREITSNPRYSEVVAYYVEA